MNYVTLLLKALGEFFYWRRVMAEIEARRLVITEKEKIEDETDELQRQYDYAFAKAQNGDTKALALVDRMRGRLAMRNSLAATITARLSESPSGPSNPNQGGAIQGGSSPGMDQRKEVSPGGG